jgi:hypothetical protein
MTRGSYFCANGVAEEQLAVWSPTENLSSVRLDIVKLFNLHSLKCSSA